MQSPSTTRPAHSNSNTPFERSYQIILTLSTASQSVKKRLCYRIAKNIIVSTFIVKPTYFSTHQISTTPSQNLATSLLPHFDIFPTYLPQITRLNPSYIDLMTKSSIRLYPTHILLPTLTARTLSFFSSSYTIWTLRILANM